MPLQPMGSWPSSNHLDSRGCCCHGSLCSQAGPLMAVLPDGHPCSRLSSMPGHIAALLQSQLLRMINPLNSTDPVNTEPRRETSEQAPGSVCEIPGHSPC